jgi:hypothetical protein
LDADKGSAAGRDETERTRASFRCARGNADRGRAGTGASAVIEVVGGVAVVGGAMAA